MMYDSWLKGDQSEPFNKGGFPDLSEMWAEGEGCMPKLKNAGQWLPMLSMPPPQLAPPPLPLLLLLLLLLLLHVVLASERACADARNFQG